MDSRRESPDEDAPQAPATTQDLGRLFAAPRWLRDMGVSAWLAVGITLFVVGCIWVLALTNTIVAPVIAAVVIAAVTSPVVRWLGRLRLGRGPAAGLVLLAVVIIGIGVVAL